MALKQRSMALLNLKLTEVGHRHGDVDVLSLIISVELI